jgi:Methylamine utilisation protein MauE
MTVPVLEAIREVQIPVVAVMLVGACVAKLARTLRTGSVDASLGPTALFPLNMRRPVALTMCAIEAGLGVGLIITAAGPGDKAAAGVRIGAGLLFLIATSALIELRTVRPDVGCGCFGEFSTAPVSGRTIARSALLAIGALSTIDLDPIRVPRTTGAGLELLAFLCAELLVIGALSPEVGEGLIRLGYSEPCELRDVPSSRTLTALRRSKQWRRYAGLITTDMPADVWRELCWRYVVYPTSYQERPAYLVFAVFLPHRRPVVHAALVDAGTGLPLPSSTATGGERRHATPPVPGGDTAAAPEQRLSARAG